jgi:imidazole glycerol-phosphate synthase subunit HisF
MKKKMFLGADRFIFQNAEALRKNPTHAEFILWTYLRQKPLGHKFRRQHPISIYVADFYCHYLKLIIEVDGKMHSDETVASRDLERQQNLEAEGISFLRFTNERLEKDMDNIVRIIEEFITSSKYANL